MKNRMIAMLSAALLLVSVSGLTVSASEIFSDEQAMVSEAAVVFTASAEENAAGDSVIENNTVQETVSEEVAAEETVVEEMIVLDSVEENNELLKDETVSEDVVEDSGIKTSTTEEGGFSIPSTDWGYYVSVGDEVEMDVNISVNAGYRVTYKWYLMDDNNNLQLLSGVNGDVYKVTAKKDEVYCCLIEDNAGYQKYVYFEIYIEQESDARDWEIFIDLMLQSAVAGDSVVMTPVILGREYSELSYQWYEYVEMSGEQAIEGATNYTYTAEDVQAGDCFYCVITDEEGNSEKVTFELEVKVPDVAAPVVSSAAAVSGKKITVTWEAVENASGYRIYRKSEDTSWKALGDVDATVTSYTDSTPVAGITYTYTVRAYELVNETPYWSKYEAGKSAVAKTAAPKVTVKEQAYNKIQVSWNEVADAAGYRVCRRRQGETRWTELTVVSSTTTTYIDTAVEPGIKYYYTIRGYCESNGKTLWGQFRSSGVAITARTAPPALVSAKSLGYNKIRITWNAVSGADGYRVYRKVKNGTWKLIGNASASAVTYTDGKAQTGVTYYYTVRSYCTVDGKNILGKYYVNGIKGIARLSAPTLVSAKINSTSQTKITWNTVEGATGYRIYRKTTSGSWKLIRIMRSSAATSYTDTTAKGKSYRYTVRAYRTVGEENILGSYYKNGIKSTK